VIVAEPQTAPQSDPQTLAEWRAERDARIRACFDKGMLLVEASRATGISRDNIAAWSMRNDVFWPTYVRPLRGVSVDDMPPLPPLVAADLCPSACRQLWASVLTDQWNAVFGNHIGDGADQRKRDAVSWFASRDFACVCTLAGVDSAYVLMRYRRALAQFADAVAGDQQTHLYRRRVQHLVAS
jgi:hypothetical protein